jgi:hypothetical protein
MRESIELAVLDLHRPKSPTLKVVNTLNEPGHTESLGEMGFLVINEPYRDVGPVAHDCQVVDISNRAGPIALATIKQVKHRVVNEETGTTYLLASDGLTVVRRPRVEDDYKARQRSQMEED